MTKSKYWANDAFFVMLIVVLPLAVVMAVRYVNHREELAKENYGPVWGGGTTESEIIVEPEVVIETTDITAAITTTISGLCPVAVIYDEASEVIWAFSK